MNEIETKLAEIQACADAATEGPWTHRTNASDPMGFVEARIDGKPYGQEILGDDYFPELNKAADCSFIAHARTDIPALVKALKRAMEFMSGDWEFSDGGNAIKKSQPRYIVNIETEIAAILSSK